jgi:hypothetical protein
VGSENGFSSQHSCWDDATLRRAGPSGQPFATACTIGGLECKQYLLLSKSAAESCQSEMLRGMMGTTFWLRQPVIHR